jgi:hypothetical protein
MSNKENNRRLCKWCKRRRFVKFFLAPNELELHLSNGHNICKDCSHIKQLSSKDKYWQQLQMICKNNEVFEEFGKLLFNSLSRDVYSYFLSPILFTCEECVDILLWMSSVAAENVPFEPINFGNAKAENDRY